MRNTQNELNLKKKDVSSKANNKSENKSIFFIDYFFLIRFR